MPRAIPLAITIPTHPKSHAVLSILRLVRAGHQLRLAQHLGVQHVGFLAIVRDGVASGLFDHDVFVVGHVGQAAGGQECEGAIAEKEEKWRRMLCIAVPRDRWPRESPCSVGIVGSPLEMKLKSSAVRPFSGPGQTPQSRVV